MSGPTTPQGLLNELTYCIYRNERIQAPNISLSAWKRFFPNVDAMERRFQQEIAEGRNGA